MGIVNLKYGNGIVTLNARGAQSVEKLPAPAILPLKDIENAFPIAASYPCTASAGLHMLIRPTDKITLVIRNLNCSWMRQDQILPPLIRYLLMVGIPLRNIKILIANGLNPPPLEEEMPTLVTPRFYEKVKVVSHNCDASNLVYLGKTSHGTPIWVHPLLRGRKIILLDGIRNSPLLGFTGGPECLLSVCGRATITSCCRQGISEGEPPAPGITTNPLAKSPLMEDAIEISARIQPLFAVYLLMSQGKHAGIFCGQWLDAWYRGCSACTQAYGVPMPHSIDIVVAACGGSPADATLENVAHALCAVSTAVPDGGTIIFTAECHNGAGSPAFARWMETLDNGMFEQALEAEPDPEGLLLRIMLKVLRSRNVLLQTKLHTQSLSIVGTQLFRTMETLEAQVSFVGKRVCIIPDAMEIMPHHSVGNSV